MPMASFFVLEIVEVIKLLEKMKDRMKFEHELQYVAISNALGKAFNKNYKSGRAIITSLSSNSPSKEKTTYSVSLQGVGALRKTEEE